MKGYKATYNMKCRTLTYEVGKTYTIDNAMMCSSGFHFCELMKDVTDYYGWSENFILLEVEAVGSVDTIGNKSVTDSLKVIRVVPIEEYEFYISKNTPLDANYDLNLIDKTLDEKGRVIYSKDAMGDEIWNTYDDNDNVIYSKTLYKRTNRNSPPILYEKWFTYDSNNNMIHRKDCDGSEIWATYDDKGNQLTYRDSHGHEQFYGYDDKGNRISMSYPKRDISWKITISE